MGIEGKLREERWTKAREEELEWIKQRRRKRGETKTGWCSNMNAIRDWLEALNKEVIESGRMEEGFGHNKPLEERIEKEWKRYFDSVTGVELDPERVMRAREDEMKFVKKHGVYEKVPMKRRQGRRR